MTAPQVGAPYEKTMAMMTIVLGDCSMTQSDSGGEPVTSYRIIDFGYPRALARSRSYIFEPRRSCHCAFAGRRLVD